ncbi:MAG: CPBP family intramembrane metalloprotease [Gemmatimonadota bacterium]|nr:MAG: CPBP family intramembrane metalloprotease [Gemmatimonadota bacterium]
MKSEAGLALVYFLLYMGYLFLNPESELGHWLTLVALPLALLILYQRRVWDNWSLEKTLTTVGLEKGSLTRGLVWAIPLGLGVSLVLQLLLSNNVDAFRELITSGRFLYLLPLALVLLLLTAGLTEEFFFRGVLQTRLAALLRSNVLAILVVSVLFGLYHLPYAYLNPHWPSAGDLGAAFQAAMVNGMLGGVVLGAVYVFARGNLLAPVIVHALIDLFPAMTQIRFG